MLVKEIFYPLTTPEAVTATYEGGEVLVGTVGSDEEMNTPLMLTDAAFWKVYQFRFLAGKPFTEADFQNRYVSKIYDMIKETMQIYEKSSDNIRNDADKVTRAAAERLERNLLPTWSQEMNCMQ